MAEYHDGAGSPTRRYRYAETGAVPLSYSDANGDYSVHSDALAMTNSSGTTVWSSVLSPYGQPTVNRDIDGDGREVAFNMRLPGQYHDRATGLYYNRNRTYDPAAGRYLQSDPIGLLGGLNTYSYAAGNPVNAIDPNGLRVYVGQRPAFVSSSLNPFNHAAIVLRPDNPSDFENNPLFKETNGREATLGGQAFGEGSGLFGRLQSAFNHPGDSPENLNNITAVCSPEGMSDTEFINNLISAAESYGDDALYDPFPDPLGLTYNSNSYVSGVLTAAGANAPSLPGIRPGYGQPLPIE